MRHGKVASVLLALALVGNACAAPQRAGPGQPGPAVQPQIAAPKVITAAVRADPRTLSDAINFASGGSVAGVQEIEQLLNAGLLLLDSQGNLRPQLAEAAPTVENGLWKLFPDGRMETTWRLNQGVRWHDGAAFTAEDVVFTGKVAQDRSLSISQDAGFRQVESVEAPDARTVTVRWKSLYVDADKLFTRTNLGNRNMPLPRHLLENAYTQDSTAFLASPHFGEDYVGTGPYRLKDWTRGSHLVMQAYDGYVLGRPKIDEIRVRFILDTNVIVSNLMAGAVDLTLGRGLNPDQAILLRKRWVEGTVDAGLQNTTSLRPQFLDSQPPILSADVRFRRALMHGIDRQQIVDTFLEGFVPVAHSIVSPDEPTYKAVEPQVVRYEYDPRRSIELLDTIGLTRGPDGLYRNASGERLSIEIRSRSHALREQLQPVITDMWRQIGITGEPLIVPEQRTGDRPYQATYPGVYFRFGGPEVEEFHSCCIPLPETNYVGRNPGRYRNAEMDALLDRYMTTIPYPERVQTYAQIIRHLTEQLVLLTVFHEPEPVMLHKRLVNAGGRKGQSIQTWNAHDWEAR